MCSCSESNIEDGCNVRCWDELIPDALGLIFKNLPLQDVLIIVILGVCKSWQKSCGVCMSWQKSWVGVSSKETFELIADKDTITALLPGLANPWNDNKHILK
nr:F-box protein FBW2 [Ipomoea batatas]